MRSDFGYFEEEKLGKVYDTGLLKRLYPFIKPYRRLTLISIVLVILITLLELALPLVTKTAVDRHIVPAVDADGALPSQGSSMGEQAGQGSTRYLRVNAQDPRVAAVIQKHEELFRRVDQEALIAFDHLSALDRRDLALLRYDDLAGIGRLTLYLLGLILGSFVCSFLQVLVMEYAGQMIMHDLRVRLFEHIQALPVAFFNQHPVGRLVTRVTNDVQNMHELFTSLISFVFKDLFLLVGIAVILLGIDWQLALVSFAVLPFVCLAAFRFSRRARDVFRILRIKVAEINTRFAETVGGMRIIQLYRREKANYRRFASLNHDNYLAGMRQIRILAVFMPLVELLGVVATATIICYGGLGVLSQRMTLGALVAFIAYLKMFFRPIRDIAEKYNILQNAMASAERIFQILDRDQTAVSKVSAGRSSVSRRPDQRMSAVADGIAEIEFSNVSFAYVPGETVLSAVSFRVVAGESLAVVGPTGSGKTTLINLLTRFYDPSAGRIFINQTEIKDIDPRALRSKTALVTQEPFLFSDTVRENIFLGNHQPSEREVARILAMSNCSAVVDRLPEGLDTVLSEGGASISSGQRQLIAIARAFARDADLIILDEATSYVDSTTEFQIQVALAQLMRGRTSIVVAHRLSTARTADRIIVLNRGRIIESGRHDELIMRKGFYYKLNQLQG